MTPDLIFREFFSSLHFLNCFVGVRHQGNEQPEANGLEKFLGNTAGGIVICHGHANRLLSPYLWALQDYSIGKPLSEKQWCINSDLTYCQIKN